MLNDRVKVILLTNLLLVALYIAADYIMVTSLSASATYAGIVVTSYRGSAEYALLAIGLRVEGNTLGLATWGGLGRATPNLPFFVFLLAIALNAYLLIKRDLSTSHASAHEDFPISKKTCRFCGTDNPSDAIFCAKCGKQIS
jgi:ribosomal protein L40E